MEPIVKCPHCNEYIIIEQLNCRIFRHGIYKTDNKQIDPHATKDVCDELIRQNMIYGCGKPFQIILTDNNQFIIVKCEYI